MSSTTTTTVTEATNGTAGNVPNKSSTTLLADTDPDALLSEWLGELENLIGNSKKPNKHTKKNTIKYLTTNVTN
uniref:CSON011342 protein n=1 Tax=Culicoides sonorensis TaxID=179676 RepID=A0A336M5V8_CULSO